MITITSQAAVEARFLMHGERVHAPKSRTTWEGQVITVTYTRPNEPRQATIVVGTDSAGRALSFPVSFGEKVRLEADVIVP